MSRPGLLLVALLAVGCGQSQEVIPPPPQDSGADLRRPPIRPGAERTVGRGHPDRLAADLYRVVRGDVEVWIDSIVTGDGQLTVHLTVRNRNKETPLAFANWAEPGQVTLKRDDGKAYPLIPIPADRERAIREWEAKQPKLEYASGAGPVAHDRPRVTSLEFSQAAADGQYIDLDLAGSPVGFTDPILFRIPTHMVTQMMIGVP